MKKIDMVYGKEGSIERTKLYNFAKTTLINKFINIDGVNNLFSQIYFEYEWGQHTDLDFDKHDLSFYRCHAFHMVRVAYTIFKFFRETDWLDRIEKSIKSGSSIVASTINSVTKQAARRAMYSGFFYDKEQKLKRDIKKESKVVNKQILEDLKKEVEKIKEVFEENFEDFTRDYIVKASLCLAALVHDLGYPIKFTEKNLRRASEFLADYSLRKGVNFNEILAPLEDSLLVKIVGKKKVLEKLNNLDHGTLSAVFLLHKMYKTGIKWGQNKTKQTIIEVAAVLIYDHTLEYSSFDKKIDHKKDFYRPLYATNPLSYMLRVADDLQEWDRVYFEIKENPEIRFCQQCQMLIKREWNKDIERVLEKHHKFVLVNPENKKLYYCGCSDKLGEGIPLFQKDTAIKELIESDNFIVDEDKNKILWCHGKIIENGSVFNHRKMNYVRHCRQVLISSKNENEEKYIFIDYDPYLTLYLTTINPEGLKYRIKDLARYDKHFYPHQGENIKHKFSCYLAENPLMLRLQIIRKTFLLLQRLLKKESEVKKINSDCKVEEKRGHILNAFIEKLKEGLGSERKLVNILQKFKIKMSNLGFLLFDDRNYRASGFSEYELEKIIDIFVEFCYGMKEEKTNEILKANIKLNYINLGRHFFVNCGVGKVDCEEKNSRHAETVKFFLDDCKEQFRSLKEKKSLQDYYNNHYYSGKKDGYANMMVDYCRRFMLSEFYNPQIMKSETLKKPFFDAFSDFYFLMQLHRINYCIAEATYKLEKILRQA